MFHAIDHIVVTVANLDEAIASWIAAGFKVVRGGRHSIGTENALIAFADGAYIELIAFTTPGSSHPWFATIGKGGGLADFCMVTDDLAADASAMRAAGAKMTEPYSMTRDRPDGFRVAWMLSVPEPPFNGRIPFLIKDDTPRDERVPRERTHANGARGLSSIAIAVSDPDGVAKIYAAASTSRPVPIERSDLAAEGVRIAIGPHRIELLRPKNESSPIAAWIRDRGQTPFEAVISGVGEPERVSRALADARIRAGG
jgi:hypothetical protein